MDRDSSKDKPRVLDVNTALSAARRVALGVPLSQRERDTELAVIFAPKKDPPSIILSNGSGEELQPREKGRTSEEDMPTSSEQQNPVASPRESRGSVIKKDAPVEERQH